MVDQQALIFVGYLTKTARFDGHVVLSDRQIQRLEVAFFIGGCIVMNLRCHVNLTTAIFALGTELPFGSVTFPHDAGSGIHDVPNPPGCINKTKLAKARKIRTIREYRITLNCSFSAPVPA